MSLLLTNWNVSHRRKVLKNEIVEACSDSFVGSDLATTVFQFFEALFAKTGESGCAKFVGTALRCQIWHGRNRTFCWNFRFSLNWLRPWGHLHSFFKKYHKNAVKTLIYLRLSSTTATIARSSFGFVGGRLWRVSSWSTARFVIAAKCSFSGLHPNSWNLTKNWIKIGRRVISFGW